MAASGVLLYLLIAGLLVMFWRRVRGMSFDELLERSRREHHHVRRVLAKHPRGGSWKEHKAWMREEA